MAEEIVVPLHIRRTRSAMDMATVAGIICAFGLIAAAIIIGGSPASFVNTPAILIVIGAIILTILFGRYAATALRLDRAMGLLTAGATAICAWVAKQTVDSRSSARPVASRAMKSAVAGATIT